MHLPTGRETWVVAGVVDIRKVVGAGDEAIAGAIGADRAASRHRLGKVDVDRGTRNGLEPLELPRRGNVEFLPWGEARSIRRFHKENMSGRAFWKFAA